MSYQPNLSLVNCRMPVDISISPLLNNGKTDVKAGEEAILYVQDYLEMQRWPEGQRPERLNYIETVAPAAPAENPGTQIRAEAAEKGILPTDAPDPESVAAAAEVIAATKKK